MATVNKDFKVKHGLVVEGTTGTINGYSILTKNTDDQNYIIGLIGGSAVSTNTPDTVVLRDNTGSFAGEIITAEDHFVGDLTGNVTGTVSDLSNHTTSDLGEGTNLYYTDSRVKSVLTGATQSNIVIEEIGGVLHITAENGVADSTTDDLDEGTTNKYFTEQRVRDTLSGGDGISFNSSTGDISADLGTGLNIASGKIAVDRTTVDTWYDASGLAQDVQDNLDDHTGASSNVHGVTGEVVGTSDTQILTNKTIGDTLYFADGETASGNISGNNSDLTVYAEKDLYLTANTGNVILGAYDSVYVGSVSAGNTVATNSYVDNAVSGLTWKDAVNVLGRVNVPLTGSAPLTIDGHETANGYRVLLTAQDTTSENGIYNLAVSGGSYTLSRSSDADVYSELIGAAVFVMEGSNYGQTSWVQSNSYITDFGFQSWTQFSGSGSVVAGTGITVDGLTVSVDRTTVDTWYDYSGAAADAIDDHNVSSNVHGVTGNVVGTSDSQTLTNKTIDGGDNTISNISNSSLVNDSVTVNGNTVALGDSITLDTDDISEGTSNKYYTDQRVRNVLTGSTQSNISITEVSGELIITAENGVADSTTDDLEEGTYNHYFTDERAQTAAINLLTGPSAVLNNIQITTTGNGDITITAENGVADSTTDDLEEGNNNLYFTDVRAVDALEAVVPNFTAVEINSLAKQVAATTSVTTASQITAYAFAKADYRSAKFLIKTAYGSHTELTEILLTLDTSDNIAITEYATVGTNGSSMNVSADIDGNDVRVRVTTINNNSVVTVVGTLLV